jgi:elongation factor Ts
MAEITASMIKELRERTGVGMGKCKEALEEAKGDLELAIENLRKQGMASAVKKEGRATKEGQIAIAENDSTAAIVEVNAETDFVVRNDRFQEFLKNIAEEALKTKPASLEAFLAQNYSKESSLTIDQYRATIVQTIGENIQIKRVMIVAKTPSSSIGIYSHLGGKIMTLVELNGAADQSPLAKDIAMHVAAADPQYLEPTDVPQSVIDQEKEIAKSQIKGKPDFVIEKILSGKIEDFYKQNCLIRQIYIKDDSLTIKELVEKKGQQIGKPELKIARFTRWNVGQ